MAREQSARELFEFPFLGWLLNGLAWHAELVEDSSEDAGDFRGFAAFDLAAVQHVDWLSILEQRH